MDVRWVNRFCFGMGLVLAGSLMGCGSRDDWFPMKAGKHWKYNVRTGLGSQVVQVKVLRPLAVASTQGYELTGPLGTSRLGWRDGTLYADRTSNGQFEPPLPLLVPGLQRTKEEQKRIDEQRRKQKKGQFIKKEDLIEDKPAAHWTGYVKVLGKVRHASADLTEVADTSTVGVRSVPTIHASIHLTFDNSDRYIVLESWYQQGVGLVEQDQRTSDAFVVQLQLLGHDE